MLGRPLLVAIHAALMFGAHPSLAQKGRPVGAARRPVILVDSTGGDAQADRDLPAKPERVNLGSASLEVRTVSLDKTGLAPTAAVEMRLGSGKRVLVRRTMDYNYTGWSVGEVARCGDKAFVAIELNSWHQAATASSHTDVCVAVAPRRGDPATAKILCFGEVSHHYHAGAAAATGGDGRVQVLANCALEVWLAKRQVGLVDDEIDDCALPLHRWKWKLRQPAAKWCRPRPMNDGPDATAASEWSRTVLLRCSGSAGALPADACGGPRRLRRLVPGCRLVAFTAGSEPFEFDALMRGANAPKGCYWTAD